MKLIIACDPKGGIGYKNKLPWDKIEGDLPRFKNLTEGKVIVMGRTTWESLPKKPLSNRLHFIITSNKLEFLPKSCFTIPSLDIISTFSNAWIIGGGKLISSSWEFIDEVYLTQTFIEYDCDTFIDLAKLKSSYKLASDTIYSDHNYKIYKKNV